MPSPLTLHKTLIKLKNQISSAQNYLQLQQAIALFNEINDKYTSEENQLNEGKRKQKSSKEGNIVSSDQEERKRLIGATQDLIREKIRYFRKLAVKKVEAAGIKHKEQKEQKESKEQKENQNDKKDPNTKEQRTRKQPSSLMVDKEKSNFQSIKSPKTRPQDKQLFNSSSVLTLPNNNNHTSKTSTNFNPRTTKQQKEALPQFSYSSGSHKKDLNKELRQLKSLFMQQQQQSRQEQMQQTLLNSNKNQQLKRNSPSRSEKRLKQSKSVDNLIGDKIRETFTFRNEPVMKVKAKHHQFMNQELHQEDEEEGYDLNDNDDNKTQIKLVGGRNCHNESGQKGSSGVYSRGNEGMRRTGYCGQEESLSQQLQYYKSKVQFLQRFLKQLPYTTTTPQGQLGSSPLSLQANSLFQQYNYKLRQQSLLSQQLKGRLKYHQATSQQLRNRVMNEQRRYQDYITSLKEHVKQQQARIYASEKEKKVMGEVIKEYEFRVEVEGKEKLKYMEQIEGLLKEKERAKVSEASRTVDQRKELQIISRQQSRLRELQTALKQEKVQTSLVLQKQHLLSSNLSELKAQLTQVTKEKELLQQLLQLKLQEIQQYKLQVYQLKRESRENEEEIERMRGEIVGMEREREEGERRREMGVRRKVEKLKEVRGLLVGE